MCSAASERALSPFPAIEKSSDRALGIDDHLERCKELMGCERATAEDLVCLEHPGRIDPRCLHDDHDRRLRAGERPLDALVRLHDRKIVR